MSQFDKTYIKAKSDLKSKRELFNMSKNITRIFFLNSVLGNLNILLNNLIYFPLRMRFEFNKCFQMFSLNLRE